MATKGAYLLAMVFAMARLATLLPALAHQSSSTTVTMDDIPLCWKQIFQCVADNDQKNPNANPSLMTNADLSQYVCCPLIRQKALSSTRCFCSVLNPKILAAEPKTISRLDGLLSFCGAADSTEVLCPDEMSALSSSPTSKIPSSTTNNTLPTTTLGQQPDADTTIPGLPSSGQQTNPKFFPQQQKAYTINAAIRISPIVISLVLILSGFMIFF